MVNKNKRKYIIDTQLLNEQIKYHRKSLIDATKQEVNPRKFVLHWEPDANEIGRIYSNPDYLMGEMTRKILESLKTRILSHPCSDLITITEHRANYGTTKMYEATIVLVKPSDYKNL
jgi:hypothetical protein